MTYLSWKATVKGALCLKKGKIFKREFLLRKEAFAPMSDILTTLHHFGPRYLAKKICQFFVRYSVAKEMLYCFPQMYIYCSHENLRLASAYFLNKLEHILSISKG